MVAAHQQRSGKPIRLVLNDVNLGYDANIRRLVELATGRFCFFMGNDDLLVAGALGKAAASMARHPDAGFLLRSYAWFDESADHLADTVRYVDQETRYEAGASALTMCYRRSGIISGYLIDRDAAAAAASDRFDGTLFYQMHLTASVLQHRPAIATPEVLILCRASEAPEFGVAAAEQGLYEPGRYTPKARFEMVAGALRILKAHAAEIGETAHSGILRDYARHFYPFLRDQLGLSLPAYVRLCKDYARLELGRYPAFYLNCTLAYLLGRRLTDTLIRVVRRTLGRTPRLS